ncbi:MAG TPA: Flp pilus assembly protein CpaB [Candidatus Binataceae bacterium]|nr:Flp pilus assembly protein CpaB [Candidatus Binataceae bacterium]
MRRPIVFVVLAGLAAMLASVVVYSALKKREAEIQQAMAKNVEIVVAAYDLPLGAKIEAGELKMARWSAEATPEGAMTDPKQAIGSYVRSQFVANEPIVTGKLFMGQKTAGVMPLLIPFGMRAVSVPVDEVSDISGFVLPHTRVDILVALSVGGEGGNKAFSKVVLQNVEVLAVGEEVEMKKDEPTTVRVVTLLVSPQEAERLSLASREGTLRLAMRNYNDNKIVLTSGTDVQEMLRAYSLQPEIPVAAPQVAPRAPERPRSRPMEIEIYRNGKTSESVSFISQASPDDTPGHKKTREYSRVEPETEKDAAASEPAATAHAAASTPAPSEASAGDHAPPATAADAASSEAAAPAQSASSKESSLSGPMPGYVPTPKTIDVP